LKQQPAKGAQVVQDAAAFLHVRGELIHLEERDGQSLHAPRVALRLGLVGVSLHFFCRFINALSQENDKFVRALDGIERPCLLCIRGRLWR